MTATIFMRTIGFLIYNHLDCLDYDNCVIRRYSKEDDFHNVRKYSLSREKLDPINEEDRLIFIPEKAQMGYTLVHKKIVDIFRKENVDTLKFIKVSDWEAGMQFR